MKVDLETFLAAYARRPWSWTGGHVDCSMMLADWLITNGHVDVRPLWSDSYGSRLSCARLVRGAGWLTAVIDRSAEHAGLTRRIGSLQGGDVGVIGRGESLRQWAGIFDGTRWAVRLQGGIERMAAAPLTVWQI